MNEPSLSNICLEISIRLDTSRTWNDELYRFVIEHPAIVAHGVPDINRMIHKQFRQEMIDASRKERNRKYPKPMGTEEIVYGDKVINLINTDPTGNEKEPAWPCFLPTMAENGSIVPQTQP